MLMHAKHQATKQLTLRFKCICAQNRIVFSVNYAGVMQWQLTNTFSVRLTFPSVAMRLALMLLGWHKNPLRNSPCCMLLNIFRKIVQMSRSHHENMDPRQLREKMAQADLEHQATRLDCLKAELVVTLSSHSSAYEIIRYVTINNVDLIAIASHENKWEEGLFGGTAKHILRKAKCGFLVVPT